MSITLREVQLVSPNPAHFTDPYQWRVLLDVHEEIPDDLDFKVIWIGSSKAGQGTKDQILEDCEVGPLTVGANELILEHDAPNWKEIPPEELLDVTFICINISYHGQAFLRVSYFVNMAMQNEHRQEHGERPTTIDISKLCRNLLLTKPQIKQQAIDWGTTAGDESMSNFPAGGMQLSAQGASRSAAPAAEQSRQNEESRNDGDMDMDVDGGNSRPGFAVMPKTQMVMQGMGAPGTINALPCPGAITPSGIPPSFAPQAAPPSFPTFPAAPNVP